MSTCPKAAGAFRDESKGKKHQRIVYLTDKAVRDERAADGRVRKARCFGNTDGMPWSAFTGPELPLQETQARRSAG